MQILVTGGAGYIGSHTCTVLLQGGYDVTVCDNFSNSKFESLCRVNKLTKKTSKFQKIELLDRVAINSIFEENNFDAVVHFAGFKSVVDSVFNPFVYYRNNVINTLNLLDVMQSHGVFNLVFSSSATVYGYPDILPVVEDAPRYATNPYGRTKLMIENVLEDLAFSDERWKIACLRYFNPVGAHPSGLIGEDPSGIPNNLMPFVSQVAVGRREKLAVFGNDYPTIDGTGVRDYIHVMDLAEGHLAAIEYLMNQEHGEFLPINLGTGKGYSVLQIIEAFSKASGRNIPHEFSSRRLGDVAACYADVSRAREMLGWQSKLGIDEMCIDAWRWQKQNPNGYC